MQTRSQFFLQTSKNLVSVGVAAATAGRGMTDESLGRHFNMLETMFGTFGIHVLIIMK